MKGYGSYVRIRRRKNQDVFFQKGGFVSVPVGNWRMANREPVLFYNESDMNTKTSQ